MFLCNAHVHKLLACFLSDIRSEAENRRSSGSYSTHGLVSLHFLKKIIAGNSSVILALRIVKGLACFRVEGHMPVPCFLILFRRSIALTLLCYNVNGNRLFAVLYALKSLNKRRNIVAVLNENIVKTHCLEKVTLSLALGITKKLEISVHTAVVFCDRHIVIVHNDNKVCIHFPCKVDTLQSFATAERAVADNSDNIALLALEISGLCKTACKAHRGGSMANRKKVMLALLWVCVA